MDLTKLTIYILEENNYQQSTVSPNFPNLSLTNIIPHLIERAKIVGSSQALE